MADHTQLLHSDFFQFSMALFQKEEEETRAQFHGSAYRKHRIDAYGSKELCAYGKRISRVTSGFGLLRVRTRPY